ncbi:TonB-dependent receptor plug domain-containing protein, partial [Burkholderia ambifaria]|uniref:TonB-dependent receptor plug domain-containing protein n=1 Tax=Burkholderia ambifaria TaxID=152480 RepID=UPI0015894180
MKPHPLTTLCAALGALPAFACAESPPATPGGALPTVQVNAAAESNLRRPQETGSRLGLTPLETPASVEQIDRATLVERGDALIVDAVSRATGIAASPHPGNGDSELSSRGFVGASSVTQLFDGVRPYGAIGVTYPFDTWSVDHI